MLGFVRVLASVFGLVPTISQGCHGKPSIRLRCICSRAAGELKLYSIYYHNNSEITDPVRRNVMPVGSLVKTNYVTTISGFGLEFGGVKVV